MKNLRVYAAITLVSLSLSACSSRRSSEGSRKTRVTGVDPKVTNPSRAVINATGDGMSPGINSSQRGVGSEPNARAIADQAIARANNVSRESVVKVDPIRVTDGLLQPGRAAGKISIGQNAEDVYKAMGKPDGGDAAMGKAVAYWHQKGEAADHATSIYTARDTGENPIARVRQIRVSSTAFKTENGMGVGSSLADIQKAFHVTKSETFKVEGKSYTVYSDPSGISFEIDAEGNCVAVIVYTKGAQPGSYLSLRPVK